MTETRSASHNRGTTESVEAPEAASLQVCDASGTHRPCAYVVKKGDTLTAIAAKFQLKYPADLERVNPKLFPPYGNPDRISVGLRVVIPPKR
ncbi:MAG: LysM peptidoglycan-binding domain-containing protein [Chloroflexi bacterium]|nr:MAG: LysM peptidoglycan-binding domain-containing protein [Chloroflexota bacterium]